MSGRLDEARAALDAHRADSRASDDRYLFTAIARVVEHATDPWRAETLQAMREVARGQPHLTVEDVTPTSVHRSPRQRATSVGSWVAALDPSQLIICERKAGGSNELLPRHS